MGALAQHAKDKIARIQVQRGIGHVAELFDGQVDAFARIDVQGMRGRRDCAGARAADYGRFDTTLNERASDPELNCQERSATRIRNADPGGIRWCAGEVHSAQLSTALIRISGAHHIPRFTLSFGALRSSLV